MKQDAGLVNIGKEVRCSPAAAYVAIATRTLRDELPRGGVRSRQCIIKS
jgi:hypothetical protein